MYQIDIKSYQKNVAMNGIVKLDSYHGFCDTQWVDSEIAWEVSNCELKVP